MDKPFIALLMGSDSDLPIMQAGIDVLTELDIAFEVKITSAHRTPDDTREYVRAADERGCITFICAAGMAAHLAGAVAAQTLKPVIGVPIAASLEGLDALLSTVQMPAGIPVASVAIGKAGAKNAAFLAAQIAALSDQDLRNRLVQQRVEGAEAVQAKNAALQNKLQG
jgi:5-(carboxyamino)imidazole ribonucleotide mutase